jgi:upstream activation factor subunit UAF30
MVGAGSVDYGVLPPGGFLSPVVSARSLVGEDRGSPVRQKGQRQMAKKAVKKAVKKAAVKKVVAKKATKKAAAKRKPNAAFMKAMMPSAALAAIVGSNPLPRTEVTKKVWDYIKKNKLQDAVNKRMINADEKLKAVLGRAKVTMFEMTKLISSHLK